MTPELKGSTPGPYSTSILASSSPSAFSSPAEARRDSCDEKLSSEGVDGSPVNESGQDEQDVFYPEGGLEAWSVVFGSFCAMVASLGTMNTIGIFQAYIATHQLSDYAESDIAWIFSMYSFLSFFGGVQIGPYFDARGPRLLIFSGSVCLGASTLLLGSCTGRDYRFPRQ